MDHGHLDILQGDRIVPFSMFLTLIDGLYRFFVETCPTVDIVLRHNEMSRNYCEIEEFRQFST